MSGALPAHRLPTTVKAGYGAGQIAGQLFRDAPSLLLLFYLTNVIGIAPAIAGAAIFLPKVIFGAVSDLGVGILSDRWIDRFPRRRWLLIGALVAPLAMIGIFAVPDEPLPVQIVYVVLTFSGYMIAFSTFSVPYLAQFADITDDPGERTVLMAWKHGFTGVGLVLGPALMPILIHAFGGDRPAYIGGAAVLGLICTVSLLSAWRAASRIRVAPARASVLDLRGLLGVLAYRPFVVLCASAVMMTIAAGLTGASFAFLITYNMQRADALIQIGILMSIAGVVVMFGSPLWVFVARYLGKKRTYILAAIGHAAVLLAWGLSSGPPLWVLYGFVALSALFNSGWGLIVLSMLADVIARSRDEQGDDRAGSFAAVWSIIEKAGIAFGGTLLTGALLSLGGFSASLAKQGLPQPDSALWGITFAFGIVPALLMTGAILIIWRYVPGDRPALSGKLPHAA